VTAPRQVGTAGRLRKASPVSTSRPATMSGTYAMDPVHSRIGFATRCALVTKVRGSFNEFVGTGHFDAEDPTRSRVELSIRAASIDTRIARRDAHLRSNAYLAVEEHPEIRFASTAVEQIDDRNYRLTGDLSIKGVTKPVTLDVKFADPADDSLRDDSIALEGKGVVNRKDWGVAWIAALEGGGAFVGKKITLEFEVTALRTSDGA
jgi:polyisoprenoid-binding protein YceI